MDKLQFAALGKPVKEVIIDGVKYFIRRISLAERMALLKVIVRETGDDRNLRLDKAQDSIVQTVLHGCCDEQGNRIFTDTDDAIVSEMDTVLVQTLSDHVAYHNGLAEPEPDPDDDESEGSAVKNSDPSQN